MAWTIEDAGTQNGRLAVVTGANIGLGYETALALGGVGCTVVLACRNSSRAEVARAQILERYADAQVHCMALDLSSLRAVRAFAAAFQKKFKRLDLLINNAGIMMPPYSLTEDGFESQLGANYLGHFALTGLLLERLNATPGARVVALSSLAHKWSGVQFDDPQFTKGYNARLAYGQSKFACLVFAYELQRRLAASGAATLSVAAHPGVSATNLFQHMPGIVGSLSPLLGLAFNSARGGAQPTLYAALGRDIQGGDYCGPGGLGEMRGAPVKVGSNRRSRDPQIGQRLWQLSQELTGIRYL